MTREKITDWVCWASGAGIYPAAAMTDLGLFRIDRTQSLPPRPIQSRDGVGDRLRAAAFAEVQAEAGFLWAAYTFEEAPESLRESWRKLAVEERKHLNWLLNRMRELEIDVQARAVSDALWDSLVSRTSAKDFAVYMADAEGRGKRAGERFHSQLQAVDPISAAIFGKIAEEETAHIELAQLYF